MGHGRVEAAVSVALLLVASLAGCSSDQPSRPLLGAGVGLVKLSPAPSPEPGATVTLTVSSNAPADAVGGICVSLDQWRDGAWETQWDLQDRSEPSKVMNGELTCPAIGRGLPTQLALTLLRELEAGTWRLGYGWVTPVPEGSGTPPAHTIASYVFGVP